MKTETKRCKCGGEMEWQAAYVAEPDTHTAAWRGGWSCGRCGKMFEDEPRDLEAEADQDVPLVVTGQGDYRRGWTPKLKGGLR